MFDALAVMTWQHWLLAALALVGALVALSAANIMNKATECTIVFSFATTGAGLIGYAIGTVLPDRWQLACDFLLIGGIVALMIGTRRRTIWFHPRRMPWISLSVTALSWTAFLGAI